MKGGYSSEIYSIDQEQINKYADLSGGTGKIHVDPEYASHTIFGKTLVHGMLLMALIEKEVDNYLNHKDDVEYNLTFINPVTANETFQIFLIENMNALNVKLVKNDNIEAVVGTVSNK